MHTQKEHAQLTPLQAAQLRHSCDPLLLARLPKTSQKPMSMLAEFCTYIYT